MERIIRQITEQLIDRLPENQQYYKLDELREWGFQRFIVERIRVELNRNLAESLRLPQTDWANMQSETVQDIWEQFISAIRAEAWLPASYAKTVIETAVADVLETLVQPRKNIPEVIFGQDTKLNLEEIKERSSAIVVYRHFATLVPRYMEKKNLDTLSREKCAEIVRQADEKMTARYSPLNWAQMLEPLFNLLQEQIDSNLLRLFFEDKNKLRIARKFDYFEGVVDRAEFIEVLSSPDSLNLEGYEEDQSELFKPSEGGAGPADAGKSLEKNDEFLSPSPMSAEEETADEEPGEKGESDNPITAAFQKSRRGKARFQHEEDAVSAESGTENVEARDEKEAEARELNDDGDGVEEDEKDTSLNERYRQQEEEEGEEEYDDDDWEILEESSMDEDEDAEDAEAEAETNDPGSFTLSEEEIETIVEVQKEQEEETPMWQRFMSPEELERARREEQEEEDDGEETEKEFTDEESEHEGFIEEPIYDATTDDENGEGEVRLVREFLESDRELFVQEIFRGSERAFEDAVSEIAARDNWRSASKYIEKEVFKRNLVDMYSEAAVDFTDRLQTYFMEKSKN